jgi:hypothetical protein
MIAPGSQRRWQRILGTSARVRRGAASVWMQNESLCRCMMAWRASKGQGCVMVTSLRIRSYLRYRSHIDVDKQP